MGGEGAKQSVAPKDQRTWLCSPRRLGHGPCVGWRKYLSGRGARLIGVEKPAFVPRRVSRMVMAKANDPPRIGIVGLGSKEPDRD